MNIGWKGVYLSLFVLIASSLPNAIYAADVHPILQNQASLQLFWGNVTPQLLKDIDDVINHETTEKQKTAEKEKEKQNFLVVLEKAKSSLKQSYEIITAQQFNVCNPQYVSALKSTLSEVMEDYASLYVSYWPSPYAQMRLGGTDWPARLTLEHVDELVGRSNCAEVEQSSHNH